MTFYAVIALPTRSAEAFSTLLRALRPTNRAEGGGMTFYLFETRTANTSIARDLNLSDPTDGERLVELKFFLDQGAARTWVNQQIALHSTSGRLQ